MNYIAYQANDHDCGFVSLKMLLATLSKNKSYLYLRKEKQYKGFSFSDLIRIADGHGLELKAYSDEDKDLSFLAKGPALLLLHDGLTYNSHLVMVRKIRREKVYFNDPLIGEVVMKEREFLSYYSGKYLLVESYQKQSFNEKEKHLVTQSKLLPVMALHVLSTVAILGGLYFVKKDAYVFVPFIFLILFLLSELVENWYSIKLLKNFDQTYLVDYMRQSKEHVKDFREYTEMKTLSFTKIRSIYVSCCVTFFFILLLVLNDYMNCFPILLILCLSLLDHLVSAKLIDENKLAQHEGAILSSLSYTELGENLLTLNMKTNKLAFNLSLKKCLINFLLIILAFAMMLINKITSANYLIFTFASYFILYDQTSKILSFDSLSKQYQKKKERFLEVIEISNNS